MAVVEANERRILVAVDGGEESTYALSWCLKNMLCGNDKTTLVLLYAKQPPTVYSSVDGTGYFFSTEVLAAIDNNSNGVANRVVDDARKICKEACHGLNVDAIVECGDARDVICEMAKKLNVDLVVMGSRGYGLIKRTFLGSVSNHCAHNIKCPILIVKRPKSTTTTITNTN